MKSDITLKRLRIAVAANELCKTMPFSAMTVDDVCARAGVSRSSFYRAFRDKYDIAVWYQDFPLQAGIGEMGRTLTCAQATRATIEGFNVLIDLYNAMKSQTETPHREDVSRLKARALMEETVAVYHHVPIDRQLSMQIEWSVCAHTHMMIDFAQGKIDAPVDEFARDVASCFPARLRAILDAPVEPRDEARPFAPDFLTGLLAS